MSYLTEFINKGSSKLNTILSAIVEITNISSNYDECLSTIFTIIDRIVSEKNEPDTIALGIFCINAMVRK